MTRLLCLSAVLDFDLVQPSRKIDQPLEFRTNGSATAGLLALPMMLTLGRLNVTL